MVTEVTIYLANDWSGLRNAKLDKVRQSVCSGSGKEMAGQIRCRQRLRLCCEGMARRNGVAERLMRDVWSEQGGVGRVGFGDSRFDKGRGGICFV